MHVVGDPRTHCVKSGTVDPFSRSGLAQELRTLPARQRAVLGLDDWLIDLVDIAVTAAVVLTSSADSRGMQERLEWIADNAPVPPIDETDLEGYVSKLGELADSRFARWVKKLEADHWRRFLRQLLGAGQYDRLASALRADAESVTLGMRAFATYAQPFAVAFDDCVSVLPPKQIEDSGLFTGGMAISVLRVIVQIDSAMERLLLSGFSWPDAKAQVASESDDDLSALVEQLRPLVSGPTRATLAEISVKLSRKLRGASTALDHSEDGVSQAANSLVELIDRLLRHAFPSDEVLKWVRSSQRVGSDYVQEQNGRPTKKAQAMCFVYGGAATLDKSALHELLGSAIVAVRNQLQKFKHADEGTAEEAAALRNLIAAIEGFLMLAIRIGWANMPENKVGLLRARLAA